MLLRHKLDLDLWNSDQTGVQEPEIADEDQPLLRDGFQALARYDFRLTGQNSYSGCGVGGLDYGLGERMCAQPLGGGSDGE